MLSPGHRQLLAEHIASFELTEPFAERLVALARTRIRLHVTDELAGLDETRFGGVAALPEGTDWPLCHGDQQPLIAQIVLRDVAPFDVERLLPPDGHLLFFYRMSKERVHCPTVLYVAEGIPLVPHRAPAYPARRVVPAAELSLPDPNLFIGEEWDTVERYEELYETFRNEGEEVSSLLGYSMPIHHPPLDEFDPGGRLLLQVDSEERAGMMWGDCGHLYYMIRTDDLLARKFDGIGFTAHCY